MIDPLQVATTAAPALANAPSPGAGARSHAPGGFAELVSEAIGNANQHQLEAEQQARALAKGEGDIVETMIAVNRADLSIRFVVTLRNRAVEAYQEIMRLQV